MRRLTDGNRPVFTVTFRINPGTGDRYGALPHQQREYDDCVITWDGDMAYFPWSALGLEDDRLAGIDPDCYCQMDSDRITARAIASKLKSSGYEIESYQGVAA